MYDRRDPTTNNCLSVYSIGFGGFENVAIKKLTIYFNTTNIENTSTNVDTLNNNSILLFFFFVVC